MRECLRGLPLERMMGVDGVGEGDGSGKVPSDPREGNGSVDCRKVRRHISGVDGEAEHVRRGA